MKILLTGATGFVGNRIMQRFPEMISSGSLRNASLKEIQRIVDESEADVIIHTAAISDIPTCEKDPEASYLANVQLACDLAQASKGRKLICFSSDQVYSGLDSEGPYVEGIEKPGNLYAQQKLEMEHRVLEMCPDAVMLRAEWMYHYIAPRGNYYLNMLRAQDEVVASSKQFRGVTYLEEVADHIEKVINLPGGAYNFGSETTRSMYEITQEFMKLIGKDVRIVDGPARHNLWMDCSKARKYGIVFSDVATALEKCWRDDCEAARKAEK